MAALPPSRTTGMKDGSSAASTAGQSRKSFHPFQLPRLSDIQAHAQSEWSKLRFFVRKVLQAEKCESLFPPMNPPDPLTSMQTTFTLCIYEFTSRLQTWKNLIAAPIHQRALASLLLSFQRRRQWSYDGITHHSVLRRLPPRSVLLGDRLSHLTPMLPCHQ